MSNVYDLDMSPPSAEVLEVARVQLRETPEIRAAGFKELRELLKENSDLYFPDDEWFLEAILRCCHWYPESAMQMLRRFAEFKKDHIKILDGLMPEQEKVAFTDGDVVNILVNRDHLGRRIMLIKQGKTWNPDEVSADQIFRMLYLIRTLALREQTTQINGAVVIMDYEGLSMKQVKGLTVGSTKRLLTFIQEAMMTRLKEVHFVKQPFIFNMVWTMFKPFVKEKLKNRMYFHGDDMKKLHKYIPADSLPANYGGTLPEINYSGKDWYQGMDKYHETYADFNKYGFK